MTLSGPRDEEERERLERARESLAALDGIPGVTVGELGFLDDAGMVEQIAENEAVVFVSAKRFTFERLAPKLPVMPVAELGADDLGWLERAVAASEVRCEHYGIGDAIEGVPQPLFAHFRFVTNGKPTPVYVTIGGGGDDWIAHAMKRFAIAWPRRDDGKRAFIATGPLKQFPNRPTVPHDFGRNSPCPCGSGLKAKRCCFR